MSWRISIFTSRKLFQICLNEEAKSMVTHNSSCSALRITSLSPHPCTFPQRFYQPLQIITPCSSSNCTAMSWAMAILVSKIIRCHSPGCERTGNTTMLVTEWGNPDHPACWEEPLSPVLPQSRLGTAGSMNQCNTDDWGPALDSGVISAFGLLD